MKIEVDTHAHTLVSGHAYNTIREMAQAASAAGLKGLALMPGSTNLFYFQNLKVVPREMYGVRLLLGTELNILDETGAVDLPRNVIRSLDLVIASIHILCFPENCTREAVTRAYIGAMENPYIDIIGHPDDGRFPVDYERLVKTAGRTGTLLEVNNSFLRPVGFRQNTKENAVEMLRLCKKHGVMVTLGTDSHVDATLGDYAYAEEVLREVDFPEELVANATYERLMSVLKHNRYVQGCCERSEQ